MSHLDRARTAIDNQDWAGAESCLTSASEESPDAETWYLLGKIRFKRGKLAAAEESLRNSLKERPDDPRSLFFLSVCALAMGQPTQAVSWIERYLALMPEDANGWHQLGLARAAEKSHAEAFVAFERASRLTDAAEPLLALAVRAADQAGLHAEGIPVAERWLACAPRDANRLRQLLRLQFLAGRAEACDATHARLREAEGKTPDTGQLQISRVVTTETWELLANNWVQLHLESAPGGKGTRIRPSLTRHDQARLLTPEWLAFTAGNDVLIEQMTHNPETLHLKGPHVLACREESCLLDLPALSDASIDDAAILVGGSAHYYHWLLDHLPRIGVAHKVPALRELKLLVNESPTEWQWASLDAIGIDRSLVTTVPDNALIRCRALWVPTLLSRVTAVHAYVPGWLRRRLLTKEMKAAPARRLLLRSPADKPWQAADEQALADALAPLGFELIAPETMGFMEQVAAFAVAEIVVAPAQQALANILFAPPQTHVVEISSPDGHNTFFKSLARAVGLRHRFFPANATQDTETRRHAPDIEALRRMIVDDATVTA